LLKRDADENGSATDLALNAKNVVAPRMRSGCAAWWTP